MGYVDSEMPQVHPIYVTPYRDRAFEAFPAEFFLLQSNPEHGGREIARLVRTAYDTPQTEIRVRQFEHEGFRAALFWIRRNALEEQAAIDSPPTLPN